MTNRARADLLLLAGFCSFLFLYGLSQFGLIGADEPRYAQVAHEMLEHGDWVTPRLGGTPWLEKPPLYYWQAMLSYKMFGASDWSARMPSAFDATLLMLALYIFLRRFRPGAELDGALIAASCAGMIGYARAASMEMALVATFTMGMLSWWAWREGGRKIWLAAFYGFMALGTLAKGPIAPFLAGLVILGFALAVPRFDVLRRTIWLPGLVLFGIVALPWYVAVQMRNPGFFREFILEHNLGRFSHNLYHHTEPFWYYLPAMALALVPWIVFALASLFRTFAEWPRKRKSANADADLQYEFRVFAACWLIVPVIFFSLSQSKLPGYILPSLPAGALLLAEYLRQHLQQTESKAVPKFLIVFHALLASSPVVPALLIAYVVQQHRMPGGKPMIIALGVGFLLCAGIALTLARHGGWRLLRFVTLIPVVLSVGAVLKLGAASLDHTLSARPLARQIAAVQTRPLPLAVFHIRRELEYGLTFYRNQLTLNYDWGSVPREEHLLVAPQNSQSDIVKLTPGRRVSYLGHDEPQHVDYYWIAAAGADFSH